MGEEPSHRVPDSEYGGGDGLIQPPPHMMTPSEASRALTRAGADGRRQREVVIDPATSMACRRNREQRPSLEA